MIYFFLFSIQYLGEDKHEVAFVKYLKTTGEHDGVTGCEIFKWETLRNRYGCVDINNIIKVVHVVPGFKNSSSLEEDIFYNVDKFLFSEVSSIT